MEVRNRSKAYKNHILKWHPVYSIKHKADKLDEFYKKATTVYQKFDKNEEVAITLGGRECGNISELIQAMSDNWDLGVELLKANQSVPDIIKKESEILLPTYEILQGIVSAVKKQEQERRIDEITGAKKRRENSIQFDSSVYDDYKVWYDACMFKFIYGIKPEYRAICWRGTVQEPIEFVKKEIFPLLSQKKYETVKKLVSINGIDVLAEYGLLSYYFQRKSESGIGQDYDIEEIRNIELGILKIFKNDDNGYPIIPLYEFYEKLIDLARIFGLSYEYFVKGENKRIKDANQFIDIIHQYLEKQDIDGAYKIIECNSFATLRGWLCSRYKSKIKIVNDYFNWYLNVCNYYRHIDKEDIASCNYYDMVDRKHSAYMPISKLEMKCMVCFRFMKMLLEDGNILKKCGNIINLYYCKMSNIVDISMLKPVMIDELREFIPYNTYRVLPENVFLSDYTKYNVDENAYIWDIIVKLLKNFEEQGLPANCDLRIQFISIYNFMHNIINGENLSDKFLLERYY